MSMAIIALLLVICMAEAVIILKDDGRVSELLHRIKTVYRSKGMKVTLSMIAERICGFVAKLKNRLFKKKNQGTILIAFRPAGGLGDYIISAKVFEEILESCDCKVVVYCKNVVFGESIYGYKENVEIRDEKRFEVERHKFDLALQVDHFVCVKNRDRKRLLSMAPDLCKKVDYICDNWNRLYIPERKQYLRERLLFERCRMLGLDRWTELRMGGAFDIADKKVNIPLYAEYENELERIGIKGTKYITINRGADVLKEGFQQLKVWSKEYYEQFIAIFKAKHPDIMVVQLGSAKDEMITGVDKYCLGENMEIVKWVLKNSLCHVDCEGGLVHLATQLDTTNVVIFGPTPLHMYAYPQNINLCSDKCSNCMGLHEDWAYTCIRDEQALCMKDIKPQQVADSVFAVIDK